jgi:hypothetical protein
MHKTENFTDRRKNELKPKNFREQRSDMLVISKANQKDLYLWCLTVAVSFAIVLVFLTIAIVK